jgi:hypothetical protein
MSVVDEINNCGQGASYTYEADISKENHVPAGKVICISSVHEVIPWAGHVNYAASKGGVMLMMKSVDAGGRAVPHPGEQHRPRSHSHPDQYGSMGLTRALPGTA